MNEEVRDLLLTGKNVGHQKQKEGEIMNAPLTSSMFMFFLVSLWIIACVSQASAASPKLVNLTGTLYSPGQNNSPGKEGEMGLSTFNVSIQSKEWILDLKRAQNLEGNELRPRDS